MTNFNQNIITDDDLVHGTIETFRPCFAGSQDTFYVGTISFFDTPGYKELTRYL